jgi:hypothetical protein
VVKKNFLHRKRVLAGKSADEITPAGVRWQNFAVCVFLVLLVIAVFGQTMRFEFINYDDNENVYENPVVEKGLSVPAVGRAFTHTQVFNWIPLTTLSHMSVHVDIGTRWFAQTKIQRAGAVQDAARFLIITVPREVSWTAAAKVRPVE